MKKFDISIIAHRGYNKNYPENTLLSFQKAIDVKADYVELDVHKTTDGKIVVIHDASTKRVGDKELNVEESDLATLKTVDIGEGETIPTLAEVFELCKGKIGVQIEIKQDGIAADVYDLIKQYDMKDQVAISSFQHGELAAMKKLDENILCAVLEPTGASALKAIFKRSSFIRDAQVVSADAIHPFTKYVNKAFCQKAHEYGFLVNPWTVDNPKEWQRLIEAGVDAIITNDPEGLYNYLSQ